MGQDNADMLRLVQVLLNPNMTVYMYGVLPVPAFIFGVIWLLQDIRGAIGVSVKPWCQIMPIQLMQQSLGFRGQPASYVLISNYSCCSLPYQASVDTVASGLPSCPTACHTLVVINMNQLLHIDLAN